MNKIQEALNKLFLKHRIIFWYDEKGELREQFNELSFADVQAIEVIKNQFKVKYEIVRANPTMKYLLYFASKKPDNINNWLLDVELANYVFQTNQEAMYCQEMELDYSYTDLIAEHLEFFKNKERKSALKELIANDDDFLTAKYKMLAVLFNTENISLLSFIIEHASLFNNGNEKYDKELERFSLKEFYWKEVMRKYGYHSDNPSIYDFLIELFNSNFVLSNKSTGIKEAKILLSTWKDMISYQESYRQLSQRISEDIKVESILNDVDVEAIVQDDLFELSEKRIISELSKLISEESISTDKLNQIVKQRQNKYWYRDYQNFYLCLSSAMQMISIIRNNQNIKIESFDQGITNYTRQFYLIDYHYRQYILNYRKTKQNRVLHSLTEKVEKVYGNDWLLNYGNQWQKVIDGMDKWHDYFQTSQKRFFTDYVKPIILKNQKLFVIISDALRYEIGTEILQSIQNEKRYDGELLHMVSTLPSYTQLGMAALLPNKNMSIQPESDSVLIDGNSTSGIAARAKILEQYSGVRATAINAEDFMKLNSSTSGREFVKQYDLIYIYHNRIDKVGDDKTTEDKIFEAVEQEIEFLMDVLKKIANMNGNNMFITADHGFLYQNNELEASDFTIGSITGEIWKESRRFVLGKNLDGGTSTIHLTSKQLGLVGDAEALIPKSINRIRIKGSGSRFVHGGAMLQEVVIPLLKVTKTRFDTTKQVEVDVIKSTDKITTNILAVSFLQTDLVSEKVLPRQLRCAIFAEDTERLSDVFSYNFDVSEGIERQREVKHRFQLSSKASSKYKNQRVKLLLEEPVDGTSKWKTYKEYMYTLNISFTNDFD